MFFLVEAKVYSAKFQQKIFSKLNEQFFSHKISLPKSILKSLGNKLGQFFINKKVSISTMICVFEECNYTLLLSITFIRIFKHKLSILGWKIRKYLPPLTLFLFRNFAKVKTPEINQSALISKIITREKKINY